MTDKDFRNRLVRTLERIPVPESHVDGVVRRARTVRLRRYVSRVAVGSVALVALIVPLIVLLPLARTPEQADQRTGSGDSESRMLAIGGVEIIALEGWDVRAYYVPRHARPVIRAATFALPESDDIQASAARRSMGTSDVLLALTEFINCPCPVFEDVSLPLDLQPPDFQAPFTTQDADSPRQQDVPETHAFARRAFKVEGGGESRFFDLWVEFGQNPAPEPSISQVNDVLASLVIGPWEEPSQPDGVCNDQITKDPDCPRTIWLKTVLSAAGFEVVDEPNEQTLVGRGEGASFFIWVREPMAPLDDYAFPLHAVVDNVFVYRGGGPPGTLLWRAQGFDIRISPGPGGDDAIPGEKGIEGLVRATLSVPYTEQVTG